MNDDDDAIRRAFSEVHIDADAHAALAQLMPVMRRARTRRRIATATLSTSLIVATAAAALAIAPSSSPRSLPMSAVTESTTVADNSPAASVSTTSLAPDVLTPPTSQTPADPTGTGGEGGGGGNGVASSPAGTPERVPSSTNATAASTTAPSGAGTPLPPATTAPATTAPATTAPPATAPATTAPPATAPPTTLPLQTVNSSCGSVVVRVDGTTIRIESVTPLSGYNASISDDGPESIEVEFTSNAGTCELHLEFKGGELTVEVNEPESDN